MGGIVGWFVAESERCAVNWDPVLDTVLINN